MAECRRLHPKRLRRPSEIAELDDLGEGVEVVEVAVLGHGQSYINQASVKQISICNLLIYKHELCV